MAQVYEIDTVGYGGESNLGGFLTFILTIHSIF